MNGMDVIDERVFLEELARRVNRFFRDFPVEAHRLFGDPQAFGYEVEEMFQTLLGENVEVPFAVLFQSILTMSPGTSAGPFLKMLWDEDDDMLAGFEVVLVDETDHGEILTDARNKLGIPKGN